jgi:O-antigen ligase
MSALTLPAPMPAEPSAQVQQSRLPELLVIGGSLLAPLNLIIAASLTVYDFVIGVALVLLIVERRRIPLPPTKYVVCAWAFIVAAMLSAFRATYAFEALTQILQFGFIFFVLIPVILAVIRTRRAALASLALLCIGTLAANLHAHLSQQTQGAGRVVVFYSDNPNRLGYPTVYLLPFLIVLWIWAIRRWPPWRLPLTAALAGSLYLSIWALAASASRSATLGAAVALIVFVVFRPGAGPKRMLLRAVGLAAVVTALVVGLAATGQLPSTLEDRVERSFSHDSEDTTHLVADRENLAEAGMRAFVASPFFGTGLDNFRYVAPDYDLDATPQLPHNLWLQLLVQVGVFGTLAFGAFFLFWFSDIFRARNGGGSIDRLMLWSLFSAVVGILAVFVFAPELLDRHYYLMVGLGLAIVNGVARQSTWEGDG